LLMAIHGSLLPHWNSFTWLLLCSVSITALQSLPLTFYLEEQQRMKNQHLLEFVGSVYCWQLQAPHHCSQVLEGDYEKSYSLLSSILVMQWLQRR
jgi:hypothetical protein